MAMTHYSNPSYLSDRHVLPQLLSPHRRLLHEQSDIKTKTYSCQALQGLHNTNLRGHPGERSSQRHLGGAAHKLGRTKITDLKQWW